MGWRALENIKSTVNDAFKQKQTEQQRRDLRFYRLFSTTLGQQVLEDIRKEALEKADLPGKAVDGEAMNTHIKVRVGERNLYRWISERIKKGQPEHAE